MPICDVQIIPKEHFWIKSQRVNVQSQTIDKDWQALKKSVCDIIDGELRGRMTLET